MDAKQLTTALGPQPQTSPAQSRPSQAASGARKPGTVPDDLRSGSQSFSDALAAGDHSQKTKKSPASPGNGSSPQAKGPEENGPSNGRTGPVKGEKAERTESSDDSRAGHGDRPQKASTKKGRSESLEKVGALLRRSGEPTRSSDVIALLSGNQVDVNPAQIPDIVTKNEFIGEALDEGIPEVMNKPCPVADIIEKLDISPAVLEQAKAQGIDLDEKVNPIDFFKAIGVDPQRIVVELTRLRDGLGKGGLTPYMARASAFGDKPSIDPLGSQPLAVDEPELRRKTPAGMNELLAGAAQVPQNPGSVPAPAVIPSMAQAQEPVSTPRAANRPSLATTHAGAITPGDLRDLVPADILAGADLPAGNLSSGDQSSIAWSPKGVTDLVDQTRQGLSYPDSDGVAASVSGGLSAVSALSLTNAQRPQFQINGATDVQSAKESQPAGVFVDRSIFQLERPAFESARSEQSYHDLEADLPEGSVLIEALKTDGAPFSAARGENTNFSDQMLRSSLGLDSPIEFAKPGLDIARFSLERPELTVEQSPEGPIPSDGRPFNVESGLRSSTASAPASLNFEKRDLGRAESPLEGLRESLPGFGESVIRPERDVRENFGDSGREESGGQAKDRSPNDQPVNHMNQPARGFHHELGVPASAVQGSDQLDTTLGQRIMDRISDMVREQRSEAVISLDSPELGRVSLQVQVDQDRVNLRLIDGSERAREFLGSDLQKLQDSLAAQNLRLADVQMGTSGREFLGSGDQGNLRQQMNQQFADQGFSQNRQALEAALSPSAIRPLADNARVGLTRAIPSAVQPGRIQVMA